MGGGKGGGGGGSADGANYYARTLGDISKELYESTSGMRGQVLDRMGAFLGGGGAGSGPYSKPAPVQDDYMRDQWQEQYNPESPMGMGWENVPVPDTAAWQKAYQGWAADKAAWEAQGQRGAQPWDVTQSPLYAPTKQAAEQAYSTATDAIRANMPTGGAMLEQLGKAETNKANTMTGLGADIANQEYQNILGMLTGQTSQAISGLGGTASTLSNLAAQQAQAQAAESQGKMGTLGSLGQGAGLAFGMK